MPDRLSKLRVSSRRTEHRLSTFAALVVVLGLLTGLVGWVTFGFRQDRVAEAADRRTELTTRALDVYRAMADADAASLNAVLVDPERAVPLRDGFRANIRAATEALRVASARNADTEDRAAGLIRDLFDLLPRYEALVEVGWVESRAGHPVGTSYLSNASFLVREKILRRAKELHADQVDALVLAQRDAGAPPWAVVVAGAALLAVLVVAQRFVRRRTRRRVNPGLALATALTAAALLGGVVVTVVAASRGDEAGREIAVVQGFAEARNLGREADEAEARIMIFPKEGDVAALGRTFGRIGEAIQAAGGDAEASAALQSWVDHDAALLAQANGAKPLAFTVVVKTITDPPAGRAQTHGELLDARLSALVDQHAGAAADATRAAKSALAGWDVLVLLLMAAAVVSGVFGLGVRIREYYT
ncbi:hypothetical protein AB0I60_21405 [Actinosynnema sp. NPDC050436]|uniref:hypothetical protein n=1 Tax=Actinosynnema sp. NPDC050436 TaxID=3155659 RepID=UPI0033DD1DD1